MNHPVGALEKYLVARHISVHVARMHMVDDVVGVGVLIRQGKSESYTSRNAHDDKYMIHENTLRVIHSVLRFCRAFFKCSTCC